MAFVTNKTPKPKFSSDKNDDFSINSSYFNLCPKVQYMVRMTIEDVILVDSR